MKAWQKVAARESANVHAHKWYLWRLHNEYPGETLGALVHGLEQAFLQVAELLGVSRG